LHFAVEPELLVVFLGITDDDEERKRSHLVQHSSVVCPTSMRYVAAAKTCPCKAS